MLAEFFFDPLMRLPLLGTILMCIGASLVGVVALIRRSSLLGEMLSHASYPGVIGGIFFVAAIAPSSELVFSLSSMGGGLVASALSLLLFNALQKRWNVASDNALCIVLSLFFGFGVLLASVLQFSHAPFFRSLQLFLYGQATTINQVQVTLFAVFLLAITTFLFFFFRQVQMICFDRQFALQLGVKTKWMERILFFLILLGIVIGMRSVGLVLLSGMLIAPAIAARHLSSRLRSVFILAASFGAVSAVLGNFFSWKLPIWIVESKGGEPFALPSGPMIVLVAVCFALLSALFSPHRGVCSRFVRLFLFRLRCLEENILKKLWKEKKGKILCRNFDNCSLVSKMAMPFVITSLRIRGEVAREGFGEYTLSPKGEKRAGYIIRLHRLWEVYLVDYLGKRAEEVHASAEEMEHILTPELERELTELLGNPHKDPHAQPIPARGDK